LGIDPGRANLLIAAMEKILGLPLGTQDIILNIIGGMKISEPGIDLGIVLAIMSSFSEKPFAEKIGVIGEVGLTGEIRPVSNVEKRIVELQKMGFSGCILPEKNRPALSDGPANFSYYFVRDIREALHALKTSPAPQN
jgi:DNA repair protein RadA/Sms